jgi:hypothetical protein
MSRTRQSQSELALDVSVLLVEGSSILQAFPFPLQFLLRLTVSLDVLGHQSMVSRFN